jgi:hypothetical protein
MQRPHSLPTPDLSGATLQQTADTESADEEGYDREHLDHSEEVGRCGRKEDRHQRDRIGDGEERRVDTCAHLFV